MCPCKPYIVDARVRKPRASPLLRSLKREMRAVSEDCGLQPVTVAMAYVYFEKLVLQGRLNKQNRKLVAAACVVLAAKISSDLRRQEVKQLIDVSTAQLRYSVCITLATLSPFIFTLLAKANRSSRPLFCRKWRNVSGSAGGS